VKPFVSSYNPLFIVYSGCALHYFSCSEKTDALLHTRYIVAAAAMNPEITEKVKSATAHAPWAIAHRPRIIA
jgi:hypothetical protein